MICFKTSRRPQISLSRQLSWLSCVLVLAGVSCTKPGPAPTTHQPSPPCGSNVLNGYTDKISYFPGEEVQVFLQSADTIKLCDLGLYDMGGTLAFDFDANLFPQTIPTDEPWKKGYHFEVNAKFLIPQFLHSGIYFIDRMIPVVIKSASPADITVVYPVNTINAYCNSGGKSLYNYNSSDLIPSTAVSYHRPLVSVDQQARCMECLKWFATLGNLNIKYISDQDLDDFSAVAQTKLLIVTGHSEYWTRKARNNFDRLVDEGGNALVLSGNTMWWQVRYSPSGDQLICYKHNDPDPESDVLLKTVEWTDESLQYPTLSSIGADFPHGGYGLEADQGWNGFKIFNPSSPLLEGLDLSAGDTLALPSGEYDGAPVKGWDADGFPVLDNDLLNFEKLELIGFDRGSRANKETIATFVVMKKTATSGIIVNAASYDWCSPSGIGSHTSGAKIKTITQNAINKLLTGQNVFSGQE